MFFQLLILLLQCSFFVLGSQDNGNTIRVNISFIIFANIINRKLASMWAVLQLLSSVSCPR